MLKVSAFSSIDEFLTLAEPTLLEREAENSLMLGLSRSLASSRQISEEVLLLAIMRDSEVLTVAMQTPPYNLIVSRSKAEPLKELAHFLSKQNTILPGVVGPKEEATLFAQLYSERKNIEYQLGMDQKIYLATKINDPFVEGSLKLATENDVDIVAQWLYEFSLESLPEKEKFDLKYALEWAIKAVSEQSAYLWVDLEGVPVSVAHTGRPTKNGISIRAVYTPKERRKRGYASAVVAGVSKKMLHEKYLFCCLYTDSSNTTSNKIYEAIGYETISESQHYIFTSK